MIEYSISCFCLSYVRISGLSNQSSIRKSFRRFCLFLPSHIHRNVPMRFLKCDPSNEVGYVEEAEVFYKDPEAWLQLEYQTKSSEGLQEDIPTHIVLFDKLEKVL